MYEELGIHHVHGPLKLDLSPAEAVVLCLVRNGAAYVDDYIEHYKNLGFAHIAFLDNGSEDDTVARACRYEGVTVLRSLASFRKEKLGMKHAMMTLFGVGTWSLLADIDEFFQYPMMDSLPLKEFLRYLNANRYTSVVAHLLDMVPDATLGEIARHNIPAIGCAQWYFDSADIQKHPYFVRGNVVSNDAVKLWYGGVRERLFHIGKLLLTKHALNFGDGKLIVYSGHTIGNRRIADVTGLLLHYKYIGDVHSHIRQAVENRNYFDSSREYRCYLEQFDNNPSLRFTSPASVPYGGHESLLNEGMFTMTASYRDHVARAGNSPGGRPGRQGAGHADV